MTKDTLQRLERIDGLIQSKATGTSTKLAGRIGIPERLDSYRNQQTFPF